MTSSRRVVAEAAFGFGPFDTVDETDWTPLEDDTGTRVKEAAWTVGRSDELEHFPAGTGSLLLRNRDRKLDPDNAPAALVLTGTSGGYASTPDHTDLDVTGDIDLRADVTATDWTPADQSTLVAKWRTTGDQRSYLFQLTTGGELRLIHSPDGTVASQIITVSTTTVGAVDGTDLAVRVTMDVNDGSGNHVVRFWTAPTINDTWTQLGSTVTTGGTTSIFAGTAALEAGSQDDGTSELFTGRIRAVEVRDGIDGAIAADPVFGDQTEGTVQFDDSTGKTWDVNGDAEIVGSPWAADLLPLVPVRIRSTGPAQTLALPGTAGATASTPDHVSFTGSDIDVRVGLSMNDWTPGGFGQFVVSQYGTADIAWAFTVAAAGNLSLGYSTDGTATTTDSSTVIPGFTDGTDHAIRVVLDADNGSSGRTVTFYTSSDDVNWTQLGAPVTTAGTVTLHESSQPIAVGATLPLAGKVRWAEVRVGGELVTNPNFAAQPPGSTGFDDSFGHTWTVNGAATVANNPDVDVTLDEFYGYVRDGWKVELAPKGTNDVRVDLVDLLGVFAGYQLPDVFEDAVMGADPIGFWILDQANAERIADLSTFRRDGTVVGEGITVGDRVISPGHPPAAQFTTALDDGTGEQVFGYVDFGRSPLLVGIVPTFLAVFRARTVGELNWRTLFVQGDSNAAGFGFQLVIDTAGRLVASASLSGSSSAQQTANSVVDGKTHIVWARPSTGIGVDTADLTANSGTPGLGSMNGAGIGGGRGIQVDDHMDGWIGVFALFTGLPTLSEREAIIDAYTKLDRSRSDEQISWALDQLGVPAGMRNLDEGSVLMGPADTKGQDALAWMRLVTATEGGGLYVDHRDHGRIRFTNRYRRFLGARSTVSQATFSDDSAAADTVRYPAEGLDIAPNGLDGIVNQATVSWADGEITIDDTVSIGAYGPRQRNVETVATTPAQARSAGEWLVSRYKDPRSRIRGTATSARSTAARDDRVEALKVDDRATFEVTPGKIGAETTVDLFVDGVSHQASGVVWETTFRFAPVDTFAPWIWGTSEWDVDAYWG